MCMLYNESLTQYIIKVIRRSTKKTIKVYKMVRLHHNGDSFSSQFRPEGQGLYKPGKLISTCTHRMSISNQEIINRGFHVYLRKPPIKYCKEEYLVPICLIGEEVDLIGCGIDSGPVDLCEFTEAVFSKLTLTKKDFEVAKQLWYKWYPNR
jgi:hypothetical protein